MAKRKLLKNCINRAITIKLHFDKNKIESCKHYALYAKFTNNNNFKFVASIQTHATPKTLLKELLYNPFKCMQNACEIKLIKEN